MNVFELLNLRNEFEDIVLNFKLPGNKKFGTLENLQWFLEAGGTRNRFYNGFSRAEEICNMVLENEKSRIKIW